MKQNELLVKAAVDSWHLTIANADKLLDTLSDDDLAKEIAPGRNRGLYLLGHLAAVHDRMIPLLNFGTRMHPELDNTFLTQPDKAVDFLPATHELRAYWKEINDTLATRINSLTPEEWLQRHTSVSEEDFAKEPHRNRFNVLVGRTNHLANHYGQMLLLKK